MSNDRVRLHVEASVVLVYSSLVFFFFGGGGVDSVQKMYTSAPYHITMKTQSTSIDEICLDFFVSIHIQVYINVCF